MVTCSHTFPVKQVPLPESLCLCGGQVPGDIPVSVLFISTFHRHMKHRTGHVTLLIHHSQQLKRINTRKWTKGDLSFPIVQLLLLNVIQFSVLFTFDHVWDQIQKVLHRSYDRIHHRRHMSRLPPGTDRVLRISWIHPLHQRLCCHLSV